MIQKPKRGWFVLAVLVCTAATIGGSVSSCANTKRKAAPSATGTLPLTNCQILWASDATVQNRVNVYLIDAPIASWTSGTHSFTYTAGPNDAAGYVYYEAQIGSNGNLITYQSSAVTTSGTYTVTDALGTTSPNPVVLVASTSGTGYTFFSINGSGQLGNKAGTGGGGNFNGIWSNPGTPNDPTPGNPGSLTTVLYENSSLTLGTLTSYALCYNANASAFWPGELLRQPPR